MDTAHYDDDHRRRHEAYLTEAAFLIALREHVQRAYGPAPAARRMAPVGLNQRPFWADADGRTATDRHRIREYERTHPDARRPAAMPPAPTPRQPLPPATDSRQTNEEDPVELVRELPLKGGGVAIVDADVYPEVAGFTWAIRGRADGTKRVYRKQMIGGRTMGFWLHHVVLPRKAGLVTDHKDGDGLNNRRSNLRYATPTQNTANRGPRCDSRSQVKGVRERAGRFLARIKSEGVELHLGTFDNLEDAARAYDDAARSRFGSFAKTNYPLAMTSREAEVALDRRWDRLRAALRLRIGEGVMPG